MIRFDLSTSFDPANEMMEITQEIRDGLDFLIIQAAKIGASVVIRPDPCAIFAKLSGYGTTKYSVVIPITLKMEELGWLNADESRLLRFTYTL